MKGLVSFYALQEGLKKLTHLKPQIHLSSDDFQRITKNGDLCNVKGQLDPHNFELMMRDEVIKFLQSRIAQVYDNCTQNQDFETAATLGGLKLLTRREAFADTTSSIQNALSTALHGLRQELCSELRGLQAELQSVKAGIREVHLQARQSSMVTKPVSRYLLPFRHRKAKLTLNPQLRQAGFLSLDVSLEEHGDSIPILGESVPSASSESSGYESTAESVAVLPDQHEGVVLGAAIKEASKSKGIACPTFPPVKLSVSFAKKLLIRRKGSDMRYFCPESMDTSEMKYGYFSKGNSMSNPSELNLTSIFEDDVDFAASQNQSTMDDDLAPVVCGTTEYFQLTTNNTGHSSHTVMEKAKKPAINSSTSVVESNSGSDHSNLTHFAEVSGSETSSRGISSIDQCNWCNGLSHHNDPWTSHCMAMDWTDESGSTLDHKKERKCCWLKVSNGEKGKVPRNCNALCRLAAGGESKCYFLERGTKDDIQDQL